MSLHTDIKAQMIEAMKAREATKLSVIRGLLSAFTNEAVARKYQPSQELTDEEALNVIARAVKQRKDSIEQFEKGGRNDLAEVEKAELAILNAYLPAQMSREEVFEYVNSKWADPTTPEALRGDKNRFLGFIMKELKGKADGAIVKEIIDKL